MNDRARKIAVYSTLPLAAIWGIYNFSSGKKSASPPVQTHVMEQTESVARTGKPGSIDINKHMARPWGTDPFRTYLYTGLTGDPAPARQGWVLQGIVYSYDDPLAFVNRQAVRIGDTIDKAVVIEIEKRSVTLDFEVRQIKLTVNRG